MADSTTPLATLIDRAQDYSNSTIELLKINAIDKSAEVVSSLVSQLVFIITIALSFLIVNIGIALWVGKLLGDSFYGFFVIGGFYVIIAILLHVFRSSLIKYPVSNSIIRQMLKQKK
ncbi:MAG TPA: hypothetical protein VLM44_01240 [Lutibacter sp.]|nr:hypothetical protein [Lutibacter sp.]